MSCLWYSWLVCFSHVLHEFVSCGTFNKFCLTNPTLTCPLDFTHDLKRTHEQLKTCYSVYTLEVQVHCLFLEWPFRKDHCFSIYNQQYQGTSLWSLTSSRRRFYRVILDLIKPWTKDSVINHPEFHWSRHQRRFFYVSYHISGSQWLDQRQFCWWRMVNFRKQNSKVARWAPDPVISRIWTPLIGRLQPQLSNYFRPFIQDNPIYNWVGAHLVKRSWLESLREVIFGTSSCSPPTTFLVRCRIFFLHISEGGVRLWLVGWQSWYSTTTEHDTVDGRNAPIGMYKTL